jgi:hypothetical protein
VLPLLGLYDAPYAQWLGDKLGRGGATLEGYESIDGVRCARLRLELGRFGDRMFYQIVWLDPAHDFLVKRVYPDPEKPKGGRCLHVEDYQRVGGIWFPRRGCSFDYGGAARDGDRWLVTEAAVNLPLDAKFFEQPAPQEGTIITDPSGMVRTFGEKRPGAAREAQIAQEAQRALASSRTQASAQRPWTWTFYWSAGLLAVSAALLVVGVVSFRRGRR